jgi:DNA-binding MarR family transcriptional regulator
MPKPKLILSQFLPYQLSITSNAVSDLIAQTYRGRFALNIPEWRLMALLGECETSTQRELVDTTHMDKVTVNRATKSLEVRGLINRAPNVADGRSHHLMLTDTGRELYAQIVPLALEMERQLEQVLDADDVAKLEAIFTRLRHRVAELTPSGK